VQKSAMDVWADTNKNLKDELLKSENVMKYLSAEEVERMFDHKSLLKNIDYIFARSVELG
jgi:adenylosuccinate lyase